MNIYKNSNIKLSLNYGVPLNYINKGITNISEGNIPKEIKLENKTNINNKKADINLQTLIKLSDKIININRSQLNLLNKNKISLDLSNLNNELTKVNLNKSNTIFINEQQYIKLISPFNSKLASFANNMYTFTNKPYKQINKNLDNLYILCKSAFLNMSSIISKPIVSINPNLIKITLFYY
jgi:hypothetical protein